MLSLASDEPPPAIPFHAGGQAPALICCDHAGRRIPKALGDLGVPATELARHIGWDVGALDVAQRLAASLDAPGIYAPYSRLVIDCNRRPTAASAIPEASDGTPVPGNQGLDAAQREARVETIWRPYHAALAAALAEARARRPNTALISIHSFTPEMGGRQRPWRIGVLWREDGRIAQPLLEAFRAQPDLCVGDNQPYSGHDGFGYTVPHHAESAGRPHVMLEIRQNEIADPAGAARFAALIADALRPILPQFA